MRGAVARSLHCVWCDEPAFGEILLRKSKSFDSVFDEKGEIRLIDEEYN